MIGKAITLEEYETRAEDLRYCERCARPLRVLRRAYRYSTRTGKIVEYQYSHICPRLMGFFSADPCEGHTFKTFGVLADGDSNGGNPDASGH